MNERSALKSAAPKTRNPSDRRFWLDSEARWLALAASYEYQARFSDFIKELRGFINETRQTSPLMSALAPKADMCGANRHVCFGPKADIQFPPPLVPTDNYPRAEAKRFRRRFRVGWTALQTTAPCLTVKLCFIAYRHYRG
jgi:hypothetical protein